MTGVYKHFYCCIFAGVTDGKVYKEWLMFIFKMESIQLEGRTIEPNYGRNVDTSPTLLGRCEKGESNFGK